MEIVDIDWYELVKDGPTIVMYHNDLSPPSVYLLAAKRGTARKSLIKSNDVQEKKNDTKSNDAKNFMPFNDIITETRGS